MSLFKRGNVWWSYFFEDGIRHQASTGTSNRKQAETIEAKLKEEVTNQRFHIVKADPRMTFGDLAARFLASGSVRPHHIYHLKFLLPFFADTAVLRVTKSLADEFRRQRQSGTSTKDATVNPRSSTPSSRRRAQAVRSSFSVGSGGKAGELTETILAGSQATSLKIHQIFE